MAISASAKSRAAAISALIRRDAGFRVTSSGSTRDQGIKVRSAGGRDDYPSITVSDPYEDINDPAESDRLVEYRRHNIAKALDARGYVYDTTWIDGDHFCIIRITGKGKPVKKVNGLVEHQVTLSFTIAPDAARAYLRDQAHGYGDNELARLMADAISEMIEVSNAADQGAIRITRNEFVR